MKTSDLVNNSLNGSPTSTRRRSLRKAVPLSEAGRPTTPLGVGTVVSLRKATFVVESARMTLEGASYVVTNETDSFMDVADENMTFIAKPSQRSIAHLKDLLATKA